MLYLTNLKEVLGRIDRSQVQGEMKVTFFGYRKSRIAGEILAKLPRDFMRDLELCLAARAGVDPDNHTGYLVELAGRSTYYVRCSDQYMYFATGYELGDY